MGGMGWIYLASSEPLGIREKSNRRNLASWIWLGSRLDSAELLVIRYRGRIIVKSWAFVAINVKMFFFCSVTYVFSRHVHEKSSTARAMRVSWGWCEGSDYYFNAITVSWMCNTCCPLCPKLRNARSMRQVWRSTRPKLLFSSSIVKVKLPLCSVY